MNDRLVYLAIDLGVFLIPFLFSFHPRFRFIQTWKAFTPAVLITGTIFIIWDIIFTRIGVWSFNDRYVLGIYWFDLPIEEWLFFFCIPYACIFTHFCLSQIKWKLNTKWLSGIRHFLTVALLLLATLYYHKLYTCITFASTAILLLLHPLFSKAENFSRFFISYLILLIPFMVSNGLLTGTGLDDTIVKYNSNHILNIRVLTIPVEDFVYGMMLILINVLVFEKANK
ncbi:MAG: lycopene cyclase domain-containing protein [Flavobacteriales bacterium]